MNNQKFETHNRVPGIIYLVLAITGFYTPLAMKMFSSILDPVQWWEVILQNQLLFSSAIISFYIMNISWLLLACSFYTVFKETNKSISKLLLLSVVSGAIIVFIIIFAQSTPLFLISLTPYEYAIADSMVWIERAHFVYIIGTKGNMSSYIFYSLWLFPLAILFLQTHSITKIERIILSLSLIVAGIGYMADFILFHFIPQHSHITATEYTFYGEVIVLLWLLARGIKSNKKARHAI
ncbi:MAG: DUF4386 domain-containing protein [Bacteroidota bacterium]